MDNLKLVDATAKETNFEHTNIASSNLSGTDFTNANFSDANLSKANLSRTNLEGANLDGALRTRNDPQIEGWLLVNGRLTRHINHYSVQK